jgi:FixJ family two-component response regulator
MKQPWLKEDGARPGTPGTPLVAVVDDDLSVRQSTCRLIRSFGFGAEAFASGAEFLSSGRTDATACAILDMRMPGMDGLELQRQLARSHPQMPIVFLSAHASDDEERQALQAGAAAFFRKPVAKDALLGALRSALKVSGKTSTGERGDHHD